MLFKAINVFVNARHSGVLLKDNTAFYRTFRLYYDNIISVPNTPILQERFIDYFRKNERYNFNSVVNTPDISRRMFQVCMRTNFDTLLKQNMEHMTALEVPSFLYNLSIHKQELNSLDFRKIMLAADFLYSKKVHHMDKKCALKCIGIWFELCQGKIINTKIYEKFMQSVSCWLAEKNNQLEHLVYIMFYVGMSKKNKEAQCLIKECLHELDTFGNLLSLDELCIISSSSYKCSVRMKSVNLLKCICNVMQINFNTIISDAAYLVTFLKVLRFAKHYDFKVMDRIANQIHSKEITKMNLTAKVHILAMYADALYDRKNFIPLLVRSCIKDTNSSTTGNSFLVLRLKDISRLLWATSYLGYCLHPQEVNSVTSELQRSINKKDHLKKPEYIVGSLLSLWMMELKECKLFKAAVTEDFMMILKEKQLFRIQARLSLLFTCIQIEMPEILSAEHFNWKERNVIPIEALKVHLEKRNFLKQLFIAVSNLSHHMKMTSVCECHIPNLNILGITVISPSGKVLHIEVLDKTVCLFGTHVPHGLMKLKLRLLRNMGHKTLTICDDQFDLKNDSNEMYMFLEEEITKFHHDTPRGG